MKPTVFFITGTSGSGKSTLVSILKDDLPLAEVHDFDEGGVPDGADENWRIQRTNQWLEKAVEYTQKGKSTIICGVSVPKEIKNSPFYSKSLDVHYGFIYVDENEIRRRLQARGWQEKLIEDNIAWSAHLGSYVKSEKNHYIVDGTINKAHDVAKKFADWIIKKIENK